MHTIPLLAIFLSTFNIVTSDHSHNDHDTWTNEADLSSEPYYERQDLYSSKQTTEHPKYWHDFHNYNLAETWRHFEEAQSLQSQAALGVSLLEIRNAEPTFLGDLDSFQAIQKRASTTKKDTPSKVKQQKTPKKQNSPAKSSKSTKSKDSGGKKSSNSAGKSKDSKSKSSKSSKSPGKTKNSKSKNPKSSKSPKSKKSKNSKSSKSFKSKNAKDSKSKGKSSKGKDSKSKSKSSKSKNGKDSKSKSKSPKSKSKSSKSSKSPKPKDPFDFNIPPSTEPARCQSVSCARDPNHIYPRGSIQRRCCSNEGRPSPFPPGSLSPFKIGETMADPFGIGDIL